MDPALRAALWGSRHEAEASTESPRCGEPPPAVALLRVLLAGLSSWMPSWLLSDVVAVLWDIREALPDDFAAWIRATLAPDGVPRAGLTLEQKAVFEQALLDAKTKSHFKAAVKQLCGGKKKNTGGTPANGNAS